MNSRNVSFLEHHTTIYNKGKKIPDFYFTYASTVRINFIAPTRNLQLTVESSSKFPKQDQVYIRFHMADVVVND